MNPGGSPFVCSHDFTAAGIYNFFTENGVGFLPILRSLTKWSIQVTGLDANGANVAAGDWDAFLQGSNDGIGYDDQTGAMLEHKQGVNADGSVVRSSGNLMAVRAVRINLASLTLGSAAKVRVTVIGAA